METVFSYMLATSAFILVIPVAVLFMEVVAAIVAPRRYCSTWPSSSTRPRVAVLIPAHNESANLLPTLVDVKPQLEKLDRLLVVADNCSDDTASVAATTGAEVVERNEPERVGKGYALAWGLRYLRSAPPDVVIIVDADCRVGVSVISKLAGICANTHRPIQARFLTASQNDFPINFQVAEFALRVKNWVRPLGYKALGLPCQLMGSGMAFPWDIIRSADLASGCLVEDYKLGLDLALMGSPPLFCPSVIITSHFPISSEGQASQRLRWEQGHISMILSVAPGLFLRAIVDANFSLLALLLDAVVPPLSLLGMLAVGVTALAGFATALGTSSTALWVSSASLLGYISAVFISWLTYGRDILPLRSIPLIWPYILRKLPIYRSILSRKNNVQWVRTDRSKP